MPFQPTDLGANLYAAYDPKAYSFTTTTPTSPAMPGDPVARVNDLSGNNRPLRESNVTNRPILQTDGSLRFDGVDDVMAVFGTSGSLQEMTVVMRLAVRGFSIYSGWFATATDATANDYSTGISSNLGNGTTTDFSRAAFEGVRGGDTATDVLFDSAPFGTFVTLSVVVPPMGSYWLRFNGVDQGSTGTGTAPIAIGLFQFGSRIYGGSRFQNACQMDLGRVIIAQSALTGTDLTNAESWVANAGGGGKSNQNRRIGVGIGIGI